MIMSANRIPVFYTHVHNDDVIKSCHLPPLHIEPPGNMWPNIIKGTNC